MTYYPVPSIHRLAYDLAGVTLAKRDLASLNTAVTASTLNREVPASTVVNLVAGQFLVFSTAAANLLDFEGYFVQATGSFAATIQYTKVAAFSVTDPTQWTTLSSVVTKTTMTTDQQRSPVVLSPVPTGVKAVRIYCTSGSMDIGAVHLYGYLSGFLVELWHPGSTARVAPAHFDFGEKTAPGTDDRVFRLMNTGTTASSYTVLVSASTNYSLGTIMDELWMSTDGVVFNKTASVSTETLQRGQVSKPYYLRRVTPITVNQSVAPSGTIGAGADLFANATPIAVPYDVQAMNGTLFSNASFTAAEVSEPKPYGYNFTGSAWWSYLPISSGSMTFSTVGSNFDTLMNVYSSTAPPGTATFANLTSVGGDDDAGGSGTSLVTVSVVADTQYFIQAAGYGTNTGNLRLNMVNARRTYDGGVPPTTPIPPLGPWSFVIRPTAGSGVYGYFSDTVAKSMPRLWALSAASVTPGSTLKLYATGVGQAQTDFNGRVYFWKLQKYYPATISTWTFVPATTTPTLINPRLIPPRFDPAHVEIDVVVPAGISGSCTVQLVSDNELTYTATAVPPPPVAGYGVPSGTTLTELTEGNNPNGSATFPGDGTYRIAGSYTYTGYQFTKRVEVTSGTVNFVNCYFNGDPSDTSTQNTALLFNHSATASVVATNCTFNPTTAYEGVDGIRGNRITLDGCSITRTVDGGQLYGTGNCVIKNSKIAGLIHYPPPAGPDEAGTHNDGFQISSGSNYTITGNLFDGTNGQNGSAVLMNQSLGAISNVMIDSNVINIPSNGADIDINEKSGSAEANVKIINNTFTRPANINSKYQIHVTTLTFNDSQFTFAPNSWHDGTAAPARGWALDAGPGS